MRPAISPFGHYGDPEQLPRQWASAFFASLAIYAGLAAGAVVLGVGTAQVMTEKPVDVTFVEKVLKSEPPPLPPVEIKPAPAAAAPVIPRGMKARKLDKPPPPKPLVAPKQMPQEAPREAEPSQDKGIGVSGEPGEGDPAGLEGGMVGGRGPVALPEGAVPPKPAKSNVRPEYPKTARRAGKMGTVTLKIVILADGRVGEVQVVSGEEPFVTAAVEAVKTWKYEPARCMGQPISVYRIIQVGFKLEA